ncbi:polysaccharide deacetylase family protein [Haloprofundus halobius]|uniref:polysaccharide deacetylase family protein n=1 Tax=Haloprofundus halobius TaxID=2876194 RepID=UPI001CC9E2C0|nr:polysaccharide deacetylase family protein [Haloprofundus halobius]
MIPGYDFALGLTHDVDRPHQSPIHAVYYALRERNPSRLRGLRPGANPYWLFDDIMELEDELGVRSSFYFLQEQSMLQRPLDEWRDKSHWVEHIGRYDIEAPDIHDLIRRLNDGGWEVGLHGSYSSYDKPELLTEQKATLERILGDTVVGGRQHCLNMTVPDTWRHHADLGLRYDSSLGSSSTYGFEHGYDPIRPFDDEFVVFPLTVMERTLPNVSEDIDEAWAECERLLQEAAENEAVMTVLWHPTYYDEEERPGYRRLYRRLIERAQELGGYVGPLAEIYQSLEHPATVDAER